MGSVSVSHRKAYDFFSQIDIIIIVYRIRQGLFVMKLSVTKVFDTRNTRLSAC